MRFNKDEIETMEQLIADFQKKEEKYIKHFSKFAEPDGIHLAAEYISEISKLGQESSQASSLLSEHISKMWKNLK